MTAVLSNGGGGGGCGLELSTARPGAKIRNIMLPINADTLQLLWTMGSVGKCLRAGLRVRNARVYHHTNVTIYLCF
jgi:hypothetical protein